MMKSLRFIYAMAAAMVVLSCGGDEWHEQGILPKPAVGDTTSGDDPARGEAGQALPAWFAHTRIICACANSRVC